MAIFARTFRAFSAPVSASLAAVLLVGCGGNKVNAQTIVPTSVAPSSSASTDSSSVSPPSPQQSASSIPTPTVTAPAQDAVDAYMSFYAFMTAADRDPDSVDLAKLNTYLTGKAVALFDGVVVSNKAAGTAYKGSASDPRVVAGAVPSSTFLFLTSCPSASPTDPFVQYTVATGKVVATASPAVAPPYKLTISMQKVGVQWKVADVLVDASKTCTVS